MASDLRVIAAVDLSDISPAVVSTGARLARRLGAECVVFHVVEALSGEEDAGPLLPILRRWVAQVRQEAREGLDRLLAEPALTGYRVRGEVVEGKGFRRIVQAARKGSVGLLVLGGPPPARLLGSTAERVIRRSPVPLLVVRRPPAAGYRSLLVGVDFSEPSARALKQAVALAEPGAAVTVCHVLDTHGFPRTDEVLSAARGLRERVGEWALERSAGIPVAVRVEPGRPRDVLLQVAEEVEAELLGVGRRGHGTSLRHLFLGSVAEGAARRAPCDVLVVGPARAGPPGEALD